MSILESNPLGRLMRGSTSSEAALATASSADTYLPPRTSPGHFPMASHGDRTCAAIDCAHSWIKPWKSRTRPVFEDGWGCSRACLKSLVDAAVRREVGDAIGHELESPHRHRVPLGLVLLAQGWITQPQLQAALAAQKAGGQGRIGDWLVQRCGLPEDRVTRGLGVQWNCPVLALDGFSPSKMALAMPKRFIAEFGVIPLRVAGQSILYLACDNQKNPSVALALEQMTGLRVETGLLSTPEFETARERILAAEAVHVSVDLVSDADALSASIVNLLNERQPVASRLVRVQQYYWLRVWQETGALAPAGHIPNTINDVHDYLFLVGAKSSERSASNVTPFPSK